MSSSSPNNKKRSYAYNYEGERVDSVEESAIEDDSTVVGTMKKKKRHAADNSNDTVIALGGLWRALAAG